jgi:hypothetical protein
MISAPACIFSWKIHLAQRLDQRSLSYIDANRLVLNFCLLFAPVQGGSQFDLRCLGARQSIASMICSMMARQTKWLQIKVPNPVRRTHKAAG